MAISVRRAVFVFLVLSTMTAMLSLMVISAGREGISAAEWLLVACFIITLPWTVIGFWNAVIGFILLRSKDDPAQFVFPGMANASGDEPVHSSTAIAMCIRNEEVGQVERNIDAMIARLVASGYADRFHVYLLSDSSQDDIIAAEKAAFARLSREWQGRMEITYRLRTDNSGYKAGNIRDFCLRWGHKHDYMLTLDADSVMSASTILKMVRIMQANKKLGILQSLVVGLPSDSAFTRVFQFGMRLGMKSYTLGSAWWQGDCGPYWGHNALIRMKPFIEHCHLPQLPGTGPLSGWILSHDQVEAVYMRRAGYECRVMAEEAGSYEENPPHILEFIRRDLRWCHGNMQYLRLLAEPGLLPTSRVQLLLAILMFVGSPAWMVFVVTATAGFVFPEIGVKVHANGPGYTLFGIMMLMIFAPKIASFADALLNPGLRKQFGGTRRIVLSALGETIFSMMLAPVMAIANSIFLFRLFVMGEARGWTAQARNVQALPLAVVSQHLWPQTIFGILGLLAISLTGFINVVGVLICLPVFIGPLLAIPLGTTSSYPAIGRIFARFGLWQIPEEEAPAVVMRALELPALGLRRDAHQQVWKYAPLSREELLSIDTELENVTPTPS